MSCGLLCIMLLCWHQSKWVIVAQSCLTLCDPMDCRPPGFFVYGILQARILQWVGISFSRGSSRLRDCTQVFCIAGRFFTIWTTREAHMVPLCPLPEEIFLNHKMDVEFYQKIFLHLLRWSKLKIKNTFNLLMWYITLIIFLILKNPIFPGINPLDDGVWSF